MGWGEGEKGLAHSKGEAKCGGLARQPVTGLHIFLACACTVHTARQKHSQAATCSQRDGVGLDSDLLPDSRKLAAYMKTYHSILQWSLLTKSACFELSRVDTKRPLQVFPLPLHSSSQQKPNPDTKISTHIHTPS